ncbi:hypothetical protein QL285_013443 [Trifolium repens]|nr:hypothetical protein QL285_013443 [Trifolium repens]
MPYPVPVPVPDTGTVPVPRHHSFQSLSSFQNSHHRQTNFRRSLSNVLASVDNEMSTVKFFSSSSIKPLNLFHYWSTFLRRPQHQKSPLPHRNL